MSARPWNFANSRATNSAIPPTDRPALEGRDKRAVHNDGGWNAKWILRDAPEGADTEAPATIVNYG
eukprot:10742228-Lingulodinium_polyedra.AAC.1